MGKTKDITKTGSLTYRDLQAQNSLLAQPMDKETLQGILARKQFVDNAYESNFDITPRQEWSNISQDTDRGDYWGNSWFDADVARGREAIDNIQYARGENEPALVKIGAGIGKAASTAATTFLDGTLGLVCGIGEGIKTEVDQYDLKGLLNKEAVSKLWDNTFSNEMLQLSEEMEYYLPNYLTREEANNAWYQNMGTANFFADFIKLIGFTVGAFYSGGAWDKALKAVRVLQKAGTAKMLGAALSAVNEGRIEANNNSDDWEKVEIAKAHDEVVDGLMKNQGYTIELAEHMWETSKKDILADIHNRKINMGLIDLACNVPLLMADNLFAFGKLYAQGYDSAKRAAKSNVRKSISEGVEDAIKNESKAETRKHIVKLGDKYVWQNINFKDKLLTGAERSLNEGLEEMSLMWISESAGISLLLDSPDAYYNALTDPKALSQTKDFVTSITQGFMNSYGDFSKYQDFVLGALTGFFGSPTFGKTQNRSAETYLGRGKSFGMSGGVFGAFKSASEENDNGKKAVDDINAYIEKYNQRLANRVRHFAASNVFTDAMNGWAAKSNSFEFHNAEDNEDFAAIERFASVGMLDEYKELVNQDFENISDEELEKIASETVNKNTGKPLWSNPDGNLMSSTEEGRAKMREKLQKKRDVILDGIEAYEEYVGQMRNIDGIENNDEAVRELAWLRWKINRFHKRGKQLIKENADNLRTISKSILEESDSINEAIQNLESQENLTDEEKQALETYKNIVKNNDILKKHIDNLTESDSSLGTAILPEELLLHYVDGDFYGSFVQPNGMSYNEYKDTMLNLADISKLRNLDRQFNERLRYYLDGSRTKKDSKKDSDKKTTDRKEDSKKTTPEPQTVEERIEELHRKRDAEVEELKVVDDALELKAKVEKITKASEYLQLVRDTNQKAEIDAIIKDLENKDSNHHAVLAKKISDALDFLYLASNQLALKYTQALRLDKLYNYFKEVADKCKTVEEFTTVEGNPFYSEEAIRNAQFDNPIVDDINTAFVNHIRQTLSNLFNKYMQNKKEADILGTSDKATPTNGPTETTGADDNTPIPTKEDNPKVDESPSVIKDSIAKLKNAGVEDELIISILSKSMPLERAKLELDAFNAALLSETVTTESAAIVPQYEEGEDIPPSKDAPSNVTSQTVSEEPAPQLTANHRFFRSNTTNFPIHPLPTERNGSFNYDAWVDGLKWNPLLKHSLKARHKYLTDVGAYARVSSGEIKGKDSGKPTKVTFKVVKSLNEAAKDFVVLIADEYGNIIGDLGSLLDSTTLMTYSDLSTKFRYLEFFINQIKEEYGRLKDKPDTFTYGVTSTVDKVLVGRPPFSNAIKSILEINPELKIGVYNGTIISTGNKNETILNTETLIPLHPKRGQVYVLLPNGRKGSKNGNTAVLCTVKRFNNGTQGTKIHQKIEDALLQLIDAKTYALLIKAMNELKKYLWLADPNDPSKNNLHINAYNDNGLMSHRNADGPIKKITIRTFNGTLYVDLIRGGLVMTSPGNKLELLVNAFTNFPLHVSMNALNTEEGQLMYREVVQTNLHEGTSTTINDWFTINPIIKGVEEKAESPKTTRVNTNVTPTTLLTYNIGNDKWEVDTVAMTVKLNGNPVSPTPINDPGHIFNLANALLASIYAKKVPNLMRRGNAVVTPYGWFDTVRNQLVAEPLELLTTNLKLPSIGGFTRVDRKDTTDVSMPTIEDAPTAEDINNKDNQKLGKLSISRDLATQDTTPVLELTQLSTLEILETSLLEVPNQPVEDFVDTDLLGVVEIDGELIEVRLSSLLIAQDYEFLGDMDITSTSLDMLKAAEAIKQMKELGFLRKEDIEKVKPFDVQKELKWLSKVLPQLNNEEHLRIINGLIRNNSSIQGMFYRGVIYLKNDAAQGTTYHEAFHAVTQTLLTSKERADLYAEAKLVYGENKSILAIEEELAESFRRYVELEETPIVGKAVKLFRVLNHIIDKIFNNQSAMTRLFYDINNGKLANRTISNNNGTALYRDFDFKLYTQEDFLRNLDNSVNSGSFKTEVAKRNYLGLKLDYWLTQGYNIHVRKDKKTGRYVIDNFVVTDKAYNVDYPIEVVQRYYELRYKYDNLSEEEKKHLEAKHISKEEFDTWDKDTKENELKCSR